MKRIILSTLLLSYILDIYSISKNYSLQYDINDFKIMTDDGWKDCDNHHKCADRQETGYVSGNPWYKRRTSGKEQAAVIA